MRNKKLSFIKKKSVLIVVVIMLIFWSCFVVTDYVNVIENQSTPVFARAIESSNSVYMGIGYQITINKTGDHINSAIFTLFSFNLKKETF